ncbi:NOS-2 protein [Aphelenchoides avenae]|nr:NOS-2 protein [Aphelenchus avenae]
MDPWRPSSPKKSRYMSPHGSNQSSWSFPPYDSTPNGQFRPILGEPEAPMTPRRGQWGPSGLYHSYSPQAPPRQQIPMSPANHTPASRSMFACSLPPSPLVLHPMGTPTTPLRGAPGPFERSLPQSAPARRHFAPRGGTSGAARRLLFTPTKSEDSFYMPSPGYTCSAASSSESLAAVPECQYCKSLNRPFVGHHKKNCPVLMSLAPCAACGASGKDNHTLVHCPNKPKELLRLKPGFFETNVPRDGDDDASTSFGKL